MNVSVPLQDGAAIVEKRLQQLQDADGQREALLEAAKAELEAEKVIFRCLCFGYLCFRGLCLCFCFLLPQPFSK